MTAVSPGVREQIATRVAFFVTGFAVSAWAPLVPLARARLELNDGQLGTLLLCLGLGSVIAMPFSGGLAARYGCRAIILAAMGAACVALPLMAIAPNAIVLAIVLAVFGMGIGTGDVVMNIQAVIVEKASGRAMMSGFHGLYSVGGIAGAGVVTLFLTFGASPLTAVLAVAGLMIALLARFWTGLLPYATDGESPAFALPRGPVLLMGALCFALFLAEGSVLDWSAVLLSVNRGLEEGRAGLGYVAFSITMTAGRLMGDSVVTKMGSKRMLVVGSLCAALGFVLAALVPSWIVSVAGFALVGVGASNVVPILFTAAGRQKKMPSNLAIAAVTTFGYAGILLGPALLGYIARASTLPLALMTVAGMLVAVAMSAPAVTTEPS